MGRNEKRIFIGILVVLLTALAALVLQPLYRGEVPTIYHISVLLDGAEEEYWRNFRRGVDQAAQERNVDVSFLSRYEGEAGAAQAQALRREWEGEVDGAVVIPVDGTRISRELQKAPPGLAVAVVGPDLDSGQVDCTISTNPEQMGRRLADAIAEDGITACTVFLSQEEGEMAASRYRGLSARLKEHGVSCERVTVDQEGEFSLTPGRAAVALGPSMTETLCRHSGGAWPIYGMGASDQLLHDLEKGTVKTLMVQSSYDAGYLSLLSVLGVLEGKRQEDRVLDCYTVRADNLFTYPTEQILFPVG